MPSLGDIFGFNQARRVREGTNAANKMLDAGQQEAYGYLGDANATATGYLQPYMESGAQGQQLYADLMGLNGEEARAAAQQIITSDPQWQGQLGQASNAMLRQLNARGLSGSGTAALAGQRVLGEQYGNVLNRYAGLGQQGQTAALGGAGIAQNYGNQMANLAYGRAQQGAGLETNQATQINAANSSIGNNLLSLAGLGIKATGSGGMFGKNGIFG